MPRQLACGNDVTSLHRRRSFDVAGLFSSDAGAFTLHLAASALFTAPAFAVRLNSEPVTVDTDFAVGAHSGDGTGKWFRHPENHAWLGILALRAGAAA